MWNIIIIIIIIIESLFYVVMAGINTDIFYFLIFFVVMHVCLRYYLGVVYGKTHESQIYFVVFSLLVMVFHFTHFLSWHWKRKR